EGQEFQIHVGRYLRHDQQVVTADRQALDRLGVVDHQQLQADFRMLTTKGGEQVWCDVFGARFHRQVQLPLHRAAQVGQLHVEVVQPPKNIGAGALQRFGGVGE